MFGEPSSTKYCAINRIHIRIVNIISLGTLLALQLCSQRQILQTVQYYYYRVLYVIGMLLKPSSSKYCHQNQNAPINKSSLEPVAVL